MYSGIWVLISLWTFGIHILNSIVSNSRRPHYQSSQTENLIYSTIYIWLIHPTIKQDQPLLVKSPSIRFHQNVITSSHDLSKAANVVRLRLDTAYLIPLCFSCNKLFPVPYDTINLILKSFTCRNKLTVYIVTDNF